MERTFNGESFEVFDTLDGRRGLGIRATKLVSFGTLTGFLEIIAYSLYAWLSNRGYHSLHRFYDLIAEAWVYGILFGPLALVNTAVDITFGFCCKCPTNLLVLCVTPYLTSHNDEVVTESFL